MHEATGALRALSNSSKAADNLDQEVTAVHHEFHRAVSPEAGQVACREEGAARAAVGVGDDNI